MLKKLAIAASVAAMLAAVPATAAHADPKKGNVDTLRCQNGQQYEVRVSFSNGIWSAALLTQGNGVVRPVAFNITEPEPGGTAIKNIGAKTQTTTCDFKETVSDASGTYTLVGTVTIVVR